MYWNGFRLLVIVAGIVGVSNVPASGIGAESPSFEVLIGREFTLAPKTAGNKLHEVRLPVRCIPAEAFSGLSFQTLSVVHAGRMVDPAAVQFRRDEQPSPARIVMTVDLQKTVEAGVYAVRMQPLLADASLASPPVVDFTLTQPAAEFQAAAPLRIERVVNIPWLWDSVTPRTLIVAEKSGKSNVVPMAETWTCELRRADGQPAGRLTLALPSEIQAGGQGEVSFQFSERPTLGKSSGTLTIRAPQLAERVFETSLELTSRVSWFWLIAVLMAGIAAGFFVRSHLEKRRKTAQARITGNQCLQALTELIDKTVDPGLRTDLENVREPLRQVLQSAETAPEAIDLATTTAADKMKSLLAAADERRAALRTRIAALQVALGLPDTQPQAIGDALRDAAQSLTQAESELNDGLLTAVEQNLDAKEARLQASLQRAAANWLQSVETALARMDTWPDTLLPVVAEQIRQDIEAIRAAAPPEYQNFLSATARLRLDLESGLWNGAVDSIIRLATDVQTNLDRINHGAMEPQFERLRQTLDAVREAARQILPDDPRPLGERVHDLREALKAILQAAFADFPDPSAPQTLAALGEGKFAQVLREGIARRQPTVRTQATLGGVRAPAVEDRGETRQLELTAQQGPPQLGIAPDIGTWGLTIEASHSPVVGQPLRLNARLTASQGHAAPLVTLRWFLNSDLVKEGGVAPLRLVHTPGQPGTLTIRSEAITLTGDTRTAEIVLNVRAAEGEAALPALQQQVKQAEKVQFMVSAILIALTGFILYRNAFVGTLEDFLTAFLWGFTVDIGVAKVSELGLPLLSRFGASGAGKGGG